MIAVIILNLKEFDCQRPEKQPSLRFFISKIVTVPHGGMCAVMVSLCAFQA